MIAELVSGVMRIAFFKKSKARTCTTRSIAKALRRAGHEILTINERKLRRFLGRPLSSAWAIRSVNRFEPDAVFIHGNDISLEVLDGITGNAKTVMFTPDCWPSPPSRPNLGIARRVDLLLTVARGQIPEFLRAGVRHVEYLAESCDPSLHYPISGARPLYHSDVAFIGKRAEGAGGAHRTSLIQQMHARFDTALYGTGWETMGLPSRRKNAFPSHYREICRGSKIVLGSDWRHDCEWYFSNRTWFTLGCRGFLLTNYSPGLEDLFENHRELVWYRSPEEAVELAEHYLERPHERERIAQAGHDYVMANRTTDHLVRDLLDRIEGRPAAFPPRRDAILTPAVGFSPTRSKPVSARESRVVGQSVKPGPT